MESIKAVIVCVELIRIIFDQILLFVMFNKPKINRREKRDSVSNILEGPYILVTATSNVRIEVDVTMYRK